MIRGYARVSTEEQNLDLQLDALQRAGCDTREIYTDRAGGIATYRPGFARLMEALQAGDTLVVWRLDRLTRGVRRMLNLLPEIEARGVRLVSITEAIDTSHAAGRLTVHVLASIAQYERELGHERVVAGIAAARQRGTKFGRPRALSPADVIAARVLLDKGMSRRAIALVFNVARMTIADALNGDGAYALGALAADGSVNPTTVDIESA